MNVVLSYEDFRDDDQIQKGSFISSDGTKEEDNDSI